jgi:hypothetical protein
MERRDILIVVDGIAIVMVMALVVKPVITGKPVDVGLPGVPLPFVPTPKPTPTPTFYVPTMPGGGTMRTATPAPPVTTVAPWNGTPKTIGVTAAVTTVTTPRQSVLISQTRAVTEKLVTFATIKGNRSGMTAPFSIPFPYWELHYTVDPYENFVEKTQPPTMASVAGATASEIVPSISITVIDTATGTPVRNITPPGRIDPYLWKTNATLDTRPWAEQFYVEGESTSYSLSISTRFIKSYRIDIMVPSRYVGSF